MAQMVATGEKAVLGAKMDDAIEEVDVVQVEMVPWDKAASMD